MLVIALFLFFTSLFSLDFHDFDAYQYQLTAEEIDLKIKTYLEKDAEIKKFYKLTPEALYIGDLEEGKIDYVLHLSQEPILKLKRKYPTLVGARIAIDPGHFGGAFAELEERCVKGYFSEGDLTFLTACELKRLLEAEGAYVMLTKSNIGEGAIEEDFFTWMKRDPEEKSDSLPRLFRDIYNREDLRERARKINEFSPDITIIIHYNAHLTSDEKRAGLFLTSTNYNLVFIPGAFCAGELQQSQDRVEFLRLIVTDHIEESLRLSDCIVPEFVTQLNVPLMPREENNRSYLFQKEGIYCRNLALTRRVHTPLCYGETLIQNNRDEISRLSSHDISIHGIPCSKRIQEVAKAYFDGIKSYFNLEKE